MTAKTGKPQLKLAGGGTTKVRVKGSKNQSRQRARHQRQLRRPRESLAHLGGVVSGLEVEQLTQLLRAVKVEGGRLDPSIVSVARVVDVALVHDLTLLEELVD